MQFQFSFFLEIAVQWNFGYLDPTYLASQLTELQKLLLY